MKLLVLAALALAPSTCRAEVTDLEDVVYENALDVAYQESKDLGFLRQHPELEKLNISGTRASSLAPLRALKKLKALIALSRNIVDVSPIGDLPELEFLNLSSSSVTDLRPLARLKKLKALTLNDMAKLEDLSPLRDLPNLVILRVTGERIRDFSPVSRLTKLRLLQVGNSRLRSLAFASGLRELEDLWVRGDLESLAPLAGFPKLRKFGAEGQRIRDLAPLSGLTELVELYLGENRIEDLSPLRGLFRLEALRIEKNPYRDLSPVRNLPLKFLQAATKSVRADEKHCPTGQGVSAPVDRYCRKHRGLPPAPEPEG